MNDPRAVLADVLRSRILRALESASLQPGDRLPSARELGLEFVMDHRAVLDAYRLLAAEGLVEVRQRGGIYVTTHGTGGGAPMPSDHWLSEILAQGVVREIPLPELHEWVHRAVNTLRLRAVAVEATADQRDGMCRELVADYGLEATGLDVAALEKGEIPAELRYADLLVTTKALEARVLPFTEPLGTHIIAIETRPDIIPGEWRLLLRRPVYVLVGDERFIPTVLALLAHTPGVENVRPLVVGRDDLAVIPDGAPVYITASARSLLHGVPIRGHVLPSVRSFSNASASTIIRFIVHANLEALARRSAQPRAHR